MTKKSFLIHIDSLRILDKMTNEQAGNFIKKIYEFQKTGKIEELDFAMEMAITPFLNQFERDNDKWKTKAEANKNNGLKGGRPKKPKISEQNLDEAKKPSGLSENPLNPKKGVNVNVNVNVNDIISSLRSEIKISDDLWVSFLEHRKKVKASLTLDAQKLVLEKLKIWQEKGHDAENIIKNSIENGWKGVFEPKQETKSKQIHNNFKDQDYYAGTEGFKVD